MKSKMTPLQKLEAELLKIPGAAEMLAEERAALRAARFVRDIRESAKLSQAMLARELNISQARISQLENGGGKYGLSVGLLERVAEACGGRVEFKFAKAAK